MRSLQPAARIHAAERRVQISHLQPATRFIQISNFSFCLLMLLKFQTVTTDLVTGSKPPPIDPTVPPTAAQTAAGQRTAASVLAAAASALANANWRKRWEEDQRSLQEQCQGPAATLMPTELDQLLGKRRLEDEDHEKYYQVYRDLKAFEEEERCIHIEDYQYYKDPQDHHAYEYHPDDDDNHFPKDYEDPHFPKDYEEDHEDHQDHQDYEGREDDYAAYQYY
eukprot:gene22271-29346_t